MSLFTNVDTWAQKSPANYLRSHMEGEQSKITPRGISRYGTLGMEPLFPGYGTQGSCELYGDFN